MQNDSLKFYTHSIFLIQEKNLISLFLLIFMGIDKNDVQQADTEFDMHFSIAFRWQQMHAKKNK